MDYSGMTSLFKGTGQLLHYEFFLSAFVAPRHVDVWLPEEYSLIQQRLPVIYMHDGQNLFNPETSYIGIDWGVDDAIKRLALAGDFLPPIVVGIWTTTKRYQEYMPQKPLEMASNADKRENFIKEFGSMPISSRYLNFITKELKPFIDATYRTLPDVEHTFMMGSSMGALISLYAVCEHPQVFAGAACLSSTWTIAGGCFLDYLRSSLPDPKSHRFYFDLGTDRQDSENEPLQHEVDQLLQAAGYESGMNLQSEVFQNAEHSEKSWRERVHIPLQFLLRK
jgi:predicted alpha/beta superfamily hydrolase